MSSANPCAVPRLPEGEAKASDQSVCAVVVTYHPSPAMLKNLNSVFSQVRELVIVDNGSNSHELNALTTASQGLAVQLIENRENLGVAEALNQGVRWAKAQGYSWVILFDQDSRTQDGFLESMFKAWLSHPRRSEIASIHPRYLDPGTGCFGHYAPRAADGSPVWSMTSGALMPTWIFDKIGWFASDFFIDWVDTEYCFRIRAAGYGIAESEAILVHSPGHAAPSSSLGFRYRTSHHSPARRYYMSRNRVALFRKYFPILPLWTLKAMYAAFRETAKCFLGEEERQQKLRSFLLGTWDGLTGRMGKRQDL